MLESELLADVASGTEVATGDGTAVGSADTTVGIAAELSESPSALSAAVGPEFTSPGLAPLDDVRSPDVSQSEPGELVVIVDTGASGAAGIEGNADSCGGRRIGVSGGRTTPGRGIGRGSRAGGFNRTTV